MDKNKEEMLLIKSLSPMIKSVFEVFIPNLLKAKPESEATRRQSNILAVYLYNSPMGIVFKDMLELPDLARIFYNFKQEDYNNLYEVIERMKKEVR